MRRLVMVQFITHFTGQYTYEDSVRMALEGGCRWIQLRMKDVPDAHVYPIALRTQKLCQEYGATFIIDDRVELAKQIHADGVHKVIQTDLGRGVDLQYHDTLLEEQN